MNDITEIENIGLEALMSRAHIIFTNGYKFQGKININKLEKSFFDVVDCVNKFEYQLIFKAQNKYQWHQSGPFKNRFIVIESNDIEQEFKAVCSRSIEILKNANHYPMVLVLIVHKTNKEQKPFIIAQLSEHTSLDAGSSEVIFNKIIDYYNALKHGPKEKIDSILESTCKIKTIKTQSMVNLLKQSDFDHQSNINNLLAYPVADIGEHKIALDTIPEFLKSYKQRIRVPVIEYFNIKPIVEKCRSHYPDITKNSIISAVLAKAVYQLNIAEKGKPEGHIISFRMLSNILPDEKRQLYSGNYIAFVPVTIAGQDRIEDIAQSINERIKEFKQTQLDLSLFDLVESAVQANEVGKADDEISFIVTNWNNYSFINNKDYLSDCTSLQHISCVNIEPKDTLGGSLVNRPVMAISLSPDEQLCLSFFPSLDNDQRSQEILSYIKQIF
jgi:hypothetical protein